jgi:K+-sensing histidine kinase KdpD
MPRPPSSPLQRYGLAIALVVVATAARVSLGTALGQRQPFATFYLALILSAWYGGLGPSIVAMALGGLAALFFFRAPIGFMTVTQAADVVGIGLYFGVGAALIAFAEANRITRRRLEREVVERSRAEASIAEQLRLAE